MAKTEDTPQGFEAALKRLEAIVASMESGEMDLDNMIASFQEGQKLLQFCTGKLNEVEKKIEAIVSDSCRPSGGMKEENCEHFLSSQVETNRVQSP